MADPATAVGSPAPGSHAVRSRAVAGLRRAAAISYLLLILAFLLATGGCRGSSGSLSHVCVAGSTSVQPFAEKLAEIFMHLHPEVRLDVQGGGSSAGIFAALQGAAELGASSRELVAAEKSLHDIPIAYDGIAVIVHPTNPLTNIHLEEIRRIFLGELTDWGPLGLKPHPIDTITREEGSGTREAFEHLVMGQKEITPGALVQDSNGSVREIVAGDPYSIGYISAGLVNEQVKALAIDGVLPTPENIKDQKYRLVRRFHLVSKAPPAGPCKAFIDFVLSPQGQHLLEAEGLVGVK
jgi:phosphate transport system substrate-binding protein